MELRWRRMLMLMLMSRSNSHHRFCSRGMDGNPLMGKYIPFPVMARVMKKNDEVKRGMTYLINCLMGLLISSSAYSSYGVIYPI